MLLVFNLLVKKTLVDILLVIKKAKNAHTKKTHHKDNLF